MTTLYETDSLDDAIKDGYVIIRHPNYDISNQYWQWCGDNGKPFVAISIAGKRPKYVTVKYDLLLTSRKGFSCVALKEIKGFICGLNLKRGALLHISPILTIATVETELAIPAAKYFYQSAIDERVCE
ncbi:MAG: hypothetical protein EOM12_16905 [Verrucomicrobiae bacterium]|jgi:hypothetical protein|nr:hypothetical protein [Verrucomicrobiae bacterium]